MNADNKPVNNKPRRREDTPKSNLGDNLPYRIEYLEKAKSEPGMTPQDVAALDRVIVKLQAKLAEQSKPKQTPERETF